MKTIAVRFPEHKITRAILKKVSFPLAMPSANLSSGVSPINAQDVADEFKKKIKIIRNNKGTKKYEILSKGHRNPQGLYINSKINKLFSTYLFVIQLIKKRNLF